MKYYVYELRDPLSKKPFYVGKGSGNRAEWHIKKIKSGKITDNPYKDRVIKNFLLQNIEPEIAYVFWSDNEDTAYSYEEKLIKQYGRREYDDAGILTNLCESSRPPHSKYSDERKRIYSERMLGNTLRKGIKQTAKEKESRSKGLLIAWETGKRVVTDKMRSSSSLTHKNKTVSHETKLKISESRKGKSLAELWGIDKATRFKIEHSNRMKNKVSKIGISVIIDGIKYNSISEAAKKLETTEYYIKKRYVDKQI